MRTFWRDPVAVFALAVALTVAAGNAGAQTGDASGDAMEQLDRQLDQATTDSAQPNTELWEEYQRYRETDDLRHSNERVEIGGDVTIRENELIEGDVVAVGGTVTVFGRVEGDCVAIGGDVVLNDGAVIEGDAVAVGGKVRDTGDAEVLGERVSIDIGLNMGPWLHGWSSDGHPFTFGPPRGLEFVLRLIKLLGIILVAFLVYAVAGKRIEVVARRIDDEPGQSFLVGLLAVFATPFAFVVSAILLAITLIGILLIPVLAILIGVMALAGVTAVALTVGRRVLAARASGDALVPTSGPYRTLLVGVLAIYSLRIVGWLLDATWSFLDPVALLFNVLGVFVFAFGAMLGYGALMTSRFGTQPTPVLGAAGLPRPPAPPPPPPAPPPAPPAPPTPPVPPGEAPESRPGEEKPSA